MKTFLSLSLSILLILAQSVYAQDYVFRVLANKGSNQVKKAGSSQTVPLKTGSKLFSGDQIVAVQGAYIGLVHRTGKTLELRTRGTHNVNDLEGKISKGRTSVANRYMSFVMNKMNEEGGDVNRNYRRNLRATGAVERATESAAIKMMLKDAKNPNKVYGNKATISWEGVEGTSTYLITIKNVFDEVLVASETSETKMNLDFTLTELVNERLVIINVKSKENEDFKSRDYGIQKLSPTEAKEITAQLTELQNELGAESSLNKVVFASFFEENNLYLDALTQYEDAVKLSPEVEDYKVMYEEFILANGLGN